MLRTDLYNPIAADNIGGRELRYSPLYEKIKEARRQEEDLDQGAWKRERKVADYALVIKLTQEGIATESKDLQLAAWLTEALLYKHGFSGLEQGLICCRELITRFWDHLYPAVDDGDLEARATPLEWLGSCLEIPVKMSAINHAGHSTLQLKESRLLGYEDKAKDAAAKKARERAIKEGKLAPEDFDKAFADTPKAFYALNEKSLDGGLAVIAQLNELCEEKFGDQAPSFGKLSSGLQEVRHVVHQLLEKKRQTEPDPVEEPPAPEAKPEVSAGASTGNTEAPSSAASVSFIAPPQPGNRTGAMENIGAAAAFLRKQEPYSPAPYLMLRGLRWGELRAAADLADPTMLEAPPTEIRCQIKRLALDRRWKELLEIAEGAMTFPYSRAWLDMQRFVVEACVALGPEYDTIAKAIRSELRALVRDLPQLPTVMLADDTPAANPETQSWLRDLLAEPETNPVPPKWVAGQDRAADGFRKKFVDPYALASSAMKAGDGGRALEIMRDEIGQQRSGRGRFFRRLQLVQLCISAGKEAIAQPILEDLVAVADAHKIEDWEDRETVADALHLIMSASKRIQGDAKEKQKYFERICRLDPVKAFAAGI